MVNLTVRSPFTFHCLEVLGFVQELQRWKRMSQKKPHMQGVSEKVL